MTDREERYAKALGLRPTFVLGTDYLDRLHAVLDIADIEAAEAVTAYRRKYRLCPVGHHKGLSSKGPDYCSACETNKRKEECPHDGPRYWYNPSNLPGENRWECGACGQSMLPPQTGKNAM